MNVFGIVGCTAGCLAGSECVISGVTITINSALDLLSVWLLNSAPRIGNTGQARNLRDAVVHPVVEQPGDDEALPSPSSMLVSMRRVARAGIVKPLKVTAVGQIDAWIPPASRAS